MERAADPPRQAARYLNRAPPRGVRHAHKWTGKHPPCVSQGRGVLLYDRPGMSERKAATILFADVSGSTKLFETRGDVTARAIIAGVLRTLLEIAQRHGGSLVKTIGDEIMCTFPGAVQGLFAASDMQRRIKSDAQFVRDNLGIRIGLHHGEALFEDGDVFGDAVNVAARMASIARRDQIVASAAMTSGVTQAAGLRIRSLGSARVAGKAQPVGIAEVVWHDDLGNVTTVQRTVQSPEPAARARLLLRHRSQVFEIDEASEAFTIGRDPTNVLIIEADWVSRMHAVIEWKRGHFVLTDRSTNGSWLRVGDDDEQHVHREDVHLRRSGLVSLGQAHDPTWPDTLYFQCGG